MRKMIGSLLLPLVPSFAAEPQNAYRPWPFSRAIAGRVAFRAAR